jgi:hypothetical protein
VYRASTALAVGDVFQVALDGATVKYYRNGTVFYSGSVAQYPLMAAVAIYNVGGSVTNGSGPRYWNVNGAWPACAASLSKKKLYRWPLFSPRFFCRKSVSYSSQMV